MGSRKRNKAEELKELNKNMKIQIGIQILLLCQIKMEITRFLEKVSQIKNGIVFSFLNTKSTLFSISLKFSLKTFVIRSFARMTFTGLWVYKLNVLIKQYSIFLPTVKAVFEGNVHGVVVHAKMYIFEYFFKK